MWRKRNHFAPLVGMQTFAATVEISLELTQKKKLDLPFDPAIQILGIYPKEPKTLIQKNIGTCMFIVALFTIAKIWKQPKCLSVDEWIKQLWGIYTMEYDMAIGKKESLPFATAWMDLENIMLSEVSQTNTMISLLCRI